VWQGEYFDPDRICTAKKPYDQEAVIAAYKRLIRSMPRANQHLLLYVLDLLFVFSRKADKNLMTARRTFALFSTVDSLALSHYGHL